MPRGASRADEVGAHDGLAVPRREGVEGAQHRRHEQGRDDRPRAERRRIREQRGESVAEALGPAARAGRRRAGRALDGPARGELRSRLGHAQRRLEHVLGICAQRVADVAARHGRAAEARAAGRRDDDLLPARAVGEVAIAERERAGGTGKLGAVRDVQAERPEAARARSRLERGRDGRERELLAVLGELEMLRELRGLAGGVGVTLGGVDGAVPVAVDELDLPVGGQLRQVERIGDAHRARLDRERGVAVGGEVPERMRGGKAAAGEERGGGDGGSHRGSPFGARASRVSGACRTASSAARAIGAWRTSNAGSSASARSR